MSTHSASAAPPADQEEVDLGDDSEESDEYDEDFEDEEEADAEEEDEDDSEEGDAEEGGGLTALLLGDSAAGEDEEEEEYVADANPNATHATSTTPAGGVKRPAEVEDDAASHDAGTKKAKTA